MVKLFLFSALFSFAFTALSKADNNPCKIDQNPGTPECKGQVFLLGNDQLGIIESIHGNSATVKLAFISSLTKLSQLSSSTKTDAFTTHTIALKQIHLPSTNILEDNGGIRTSPSDRMRVDTHGNVYDALYVFGNGSSTRTKDLANHVGSTPNGNVLVENVNTGKFSLVAVGDLRRCGDKAVSGKFAAGSSVQVNGHEATVAYECAGSNLRGKGRVEDAGTIVIAKTSDGLAKKHTRYVALDVSETSRIIPVGEPISPGVTR